MSANDNPIISKTVRSEFRALCMLSFMGVSHFNALWLENCTKRKSFYRSKTMYTDRNYLFIGNIFFVCYVYSVHISHAFARLQNREHSWQRTQILIKFSFQCTIDHCVVHTHNTQFAAQHAIQSTTLALNNVLYYVKLFINPPHGRSDRSIKQKCYLSPARRSDTHDTTIDFFFLMQQPTHFTRFNHFR